MAQGHLIFHLNLAFSSIKTELRPDVIKKCYWPLLELAESTGIPIGIELTGWTLQQISALDRAWVEKFRQMLDARECELIGSGWAQLIGPVVPYEVNRWNQRLGLQAYHEVLGVIPGIALVNEMAFSTGMVDVYAEAGYQGIVMDRDNVRLALGLSHAPLSATPTHAQGCGDQALPVLWSDSILFQRLQRFVHGDIPFEEYKAYVQARTKEYGTAPLPIYCNDAEIFDFRPGRFATEGRVHQQSEWERLKGLCEKLRSELQIEWVSPTAALDGINKKATPKTSRLTSISQPIPVKKQAKYNVNRWTLTGRDDLWLNTNCHQLCSFLLDHKINDDTAWRTLCELWASDLRTHITEDRWQAALKQLAGIQARLGLEQGHAKSVETQAEGGFSPISEVIGEDLQISQDQDGIYWKIKTRYLDLTLSARRGLAVKSLAFKTHGFRPVVGTLPQGYFDSIELGADFYSAGAVIEIPGERSRLTDLEWVEPKIERNGSQVRIQALVRFSTFNLVKTVDVDVTSETVRFGYHFDKLLRPLGSVRIGFVTLLPEAFEFPLALVCKNGGKQDEQFMLDGNFDHGRPVSSFVSSTTALGATDGRLVIGDKGAAIEMSWNPADCAAMPMVQHRISNERHLSRVCFSLAETDDTTKPGGHLVPFMVSLRPTTPIRT